MSLILIIKRVLGALPMLIGISLVLFVIIHLAPGGPLNVYADNLSTSPEALAQMAKAYGLDKPVHIQYFMWMKSMATGAIRSAPGDRF